VYRYTTWGGTEVPALQPGDTFTPAELSLRSGQTEPPPKLSERDLLSLMDRFGIGTDATVAEHIARQQVPPTPHTSASQAPRRSCCTLACIMADHRIRGHVDMWTWRTLSAALAAPALCLEALALIAACVMRLCVCMRC
jgi:hypothetical protein